MLIIGFIIRIYNDGGHLNGISGSISILSNTGVKYFNLADPADFRVHDCKVVADWTVKTCGSGSAFK